MAVMLLMPCVQLVCQQTAAVAGRKGTLAAGSATLLAAAAEG